MIELTPIEDAYSIGEHDEDYIKTALDATIEYYKIIGIVKPWISYIAKDGNEFVGICSFKGAPKDNKAEIAYFTFPQHEGKGYATAMCGKLIDIAYEKDNNIILTARTLPNMSASTSVLTKNGFTLAGTITDTEDGEVFEWVLLR